MYWIYFPLFQLWNPKIPPALVPPSQYHLLPNEVILLAPVGSRSNKRHARIAHFGLRGIE
jgi:hypothetical protein